MEAERIQRSGTLLNNHPQQHHDCPGRSRPAEHLRTCVTGQSSDLPRKSIQPMAEAAGRRPALWRVLGAGPIPVADSTGATEAPEGDSGDYCAKPGTTGSIRAQPRQEKAETAP